MKYSLKDQNIWKVVETDVDPPTLRNNLTLQQLRKYEEDIAKKSRALISIHSVVTDVVFMRIMMGEAPKEAWDELRDEYEGSERVKPVKLLALKRV